MNDSNLHHYMIRELSLAWVVDIKSTPANKRHITIDEMSNWDVIATAIRSDPLYQNWIYRTNSGIFVWVDSTVPKEDNMIDTLSAFGVPDWSDETFTQYTTVAVMFPNKRKHGRTLA